MTATCPTSTVRGALSGLPLLTGPGWATGSSRLSEQDARELAQALTAGLREGYRSGTLLGPVRPYGRHYDTALCSIRSLNSDRTLEQRLDRRDQIRIVDVALRCLHATTSAASLTDPGDCSCC